MYPRVGLGNSQKPNRKTLSRATHSHLGRCSCLALLGALLLCTSGCNVLGIGNGKMLRELQAENERLLTEFRSERQRRQELEEAKRKVEQRLAESEKLIAQQYSGSKRLSQLPGTGTYSGVPFANGLPGSPALGTQGLSGQSYSGYSSSPGGWGGTASDPNSGLRWQRRVSQ